MRSKRFSFLFAGILLLFLVGSASAWDISITKLNDNSVQTDYNVDVQSMHYLLTGIDCNNVSGVWYSLNNGLTNSSQSGAPCNTTEIKISSISSTQDNNTWSVYVNDTT